MHSVDTETRHASGRPGRKAKDSGRTMLPGPIIADARLWIIGAIVVFLLSFSAVRWLPDLMTGSPDNISKSTAGAMDESW
jgi:hypothetical protein